MTTAQFMLDASNWSLPVICAGIAAAIGVALRFHLSARAAYFAGALAVIVLAIGSPLSVLAAGYSFSAHMVQHMLLLLIVPVLMLLAPATRWQRAGVHPLVCWVAGVSAMWVWHDRTLCELATSTEAVRILQIVSLLLLGTLFWSPLVGPALRYRLSPLAGAAYLFAACLACSVLGILITFAPAGIVCPAFLHPPDHAAILQLMRIDWGLTPARDQQVGGLVMWVPGCGIYLIGIMSLLARWYRAAEVDASQP